MSGEPRTEAGRDLARHVAEQRWWYDSTAGLAEIRAAIPVIERQARIQGIETAAEAALVEAEAAQAQGAAPRAEGLPQPGIDMTPEQTIDWWQRAAYSEAARAERAEDEVQRCRAERDAIAEDEQAAVDELLAAPRAEGPSPIQRLESALKDRVTTDGEVVSLMNLLGDALHEARHQTCACSGRAASSAPQALDVERLVRAALRVVDRTTPLAIGEPLIQRAIAAALASSEPTETGETDG